MIALGTALIRTSLRLQHVLERDDDSRRMLIRSEYREAEVHRLLSRLGIIGVTLIGLGVGLLLEGGRRLLGGADIDVEEVVNRLKPE